MGGGDQCVEFSALELFHFGRIQTSSIYGDSDPEPDIPRLVQLVADGVLDLGVLVTERIRIDDVGSAFGRMERGEGVRSVITFDHG